MKLISIIILSTLFTSIYGQYEESHNKLTAAVNELRTQALSESKNPEDFEDLKSRWYAIEEDKEKVQYILYKLGLSVITGDVTRRDIVKASREAFRSPLIRAIKEKDLDIIYDNSALITMIINGYLEENYPYEVQLDTLLDKELDFMDIQPNETVADIGSGTGNHILKTALVHSENDFILNEIDESLVEIINEKIRNNKELYLKNDREIKVVKGKGNDLNLGIKVDRIIVRNCYHHFGRKKAMVKSMIKHLKPGGTVIFIEPLEKENETINYCSDTMKLELIVPYIEKSGLKSIEQEVINDMLFLACKAQ